MKIAEFYSKESDKIIFENENSLGLFLIHNKNELKGNLIIQGYDLTNIRLPKIKGCLDLSYSRLNRTVIPSLSGDLYLTGCHISNFNIPSLKGCLHLNKAKIEEKITIPPISELLDLSYCDLTKIKITEVKKTLIITGCDITNYKLPDNCRILK